jgi:hypothetical protein
MMLINFSCNRKKILHDRLNLQTDVENVIKTYIQEHPQFNTFILQSTQELEQNETLAMNQRFLLGPGYETIIEKCQPTVYFDISDKHIFYISAIDDIVQRDKNTWIVKNEPDSMIVFDDWIIKNSSELFIHRAIYFYHDGSRNLQINFRPDTIFAPRLIESSIQFENILE